ncbi:MAG: hypothetical protein ABIH25_03210 [Candidatus Woesearchaeota archaeon]
MHKKNKSKTIFMAIIVGLGIVLFWRGVWQLLNVYLFPQNYELSNWISLIVGLIILIATGRLVKNWLYE